MSKKTQHFLTGSLNHQIDDEKIYEIADQCSSWFIPAGSKLKERRLDHYAFARAIIGELDKSPGHCLSDTNRNEPSLSMSADQNIVSKYVPLEGMMSAEDAADALIFHATNIANAIKRKDNIAFENREVSLKSILKLLTQYVHQDRASCSKEVLVPQNKVHNNR